MSTVVNNKGIKAGCIYRIALENFVTYKRVELLPGPSLNLIIGPNGTGKSTFVCAIILGLCGKTAVIGRAKKISEYVRHGCDTATIEIELYRERGQRNVIITRSFNRDDATTWYIDHKTATAKQVQELIASMNIQVENLCQLLPQDRVQDFSKMNPQELLQSTLAAVGGQESVDQLEELIKCRKQQRDNANKSQSNEQVIQEQQRLNDRLKVKIDAMEQRQDIEKQISICEKKKLWLEYMDLRKQTADYLNDKKLAERNVNTIKTELAPMQQAIENAKTEIGKMEKQKLDASQRYYESKTRVDQTLKSIRMQEEKLQEIESSYQEMLRINRDSENELLRARAKLEKLITDKRRLEEQTGDETRVKMELAELNKSMSKTSLALNNLKKQQLVLQLHLTTDVMPQITSCQSKIRELEDVNLKRLKTLRDYSEDCYKAVLWLRENRQLFEHNVYEPMMLEIQFSDPKFARYLESTVSARDLVAFTFESSKDMNLFLQKVRHEKGLRRVNALCSQGGPVELRSRNIQQLRYLGFYTYLVDTISAPDAIIRYLCKNYQIDNIPIGNDHTYKNSGKVPDYIKFFYTENHRFAIRVSAYSGEKSSSVNEIRPPRLLANTVDAEQISHLKQDLSRHERKAQEKNNELNKINEKLKILESQLQTCSQTRKTFMEGVNKVNAITTQIELQAKKVEEMETQPVFNIEEERERCRMKKVDCVSKQCRLHCDLTEIVKTVYDKSHLADILKLKLDLSRQSMIEQESALRGHRDRLNDAQATLENLENLFNSAKSKAKEKLIAAKRSTENKMCGQPDFPYDEQFKALPSDLRELQRHCCDLQTRRDFMDPGNEQDIKDYEEREKLIAKLKTEAQNSSTAIKQLEKRMKTIKSQWLPPLQSLLKDIDSNFGTMFNKLGGAGEIKLENGGNEEDFDKYGISIMVKFRESEQLQQLTRHAQSGGERAISTALYLMALQRLTTVPFRCVDEINQGMDAINERKMLELLFDVTTECDNAQYFLLTPKLLTNLPYSDKVIVHTIMNGQKLMDFRKWQFNKFLSSARAYSQALSD